MAEDVETTEQEEPKEEKSLWEILNLEEPEDEVEEEYEEAQEEQDEEIAKQDKLEKKLSAKMENMQKKFEGTMLRERIQKFEGEADELERDMFRTVASDVKSLEDFDKAIIVVNKQAAELRMTAEKYREQLEKQAAEQTAQAWGTSPSSPPGKKSPDAEEEELKKIAAGDTRALMGALLEGNRPWEER